MSNYVYLCEDCHKEFTLNLHMSEVKASEPKCPHCGSQNVTHELAAFSAVTSKKS
jgi:putative FmdB family regulatory protein